MREHQMQLIGIDELVDGWVYWARFKDGRWALLEVHRIEPREGAVYVELLDFTGDTLSPQMISTIEGFHAENVRAPDGACYAWPYWNYSEQSKDGPQERSPTTKQVGEPAQ